MMLYLRGSAPDKNAVWLPKLSSQLDLPLSLIKELWQLGAIYFEDQRLQPELQAQFAAEEGVYRIHSRPRRYDPGLADGQRIVFESQDFVVAHKASGLPTHPTVDNCVENLQHLLGQRIGQKLFVTHRLDAATEGLIVYAKTREFLSYFNKLLQNKLVRKEYIATVQASSGDARQILAAHTDAEKVLTHYMQPSERSPKVLSKSPQAGWLDCHLKIIDLKESPYSQAHCQVQMQLLTGRTHQIRAQLGFIGLPILGDTLYGPSPRLTDKIGLIANRLQFPLPSGEIVDRVLYPCE